MRTSSADRGADFRVVGICPRQRGVACPGPRSCRRHPEHDMRRFFPFRDRAVGWVATTEVDRLEVWYLRGLLLAL